MSERVSSYNRKDLLLDFNLDYYYYRVAAITITEANAEVEVVIEVEEEDVVDTIINKINPRRNLS